MENHAVAREWGHRNRTGVPVDGSWRAANGEEEHAGSRLPLRRQRRCTAPSSFTEHGVVASDPGGGVARDRPARGSPSPATHAWAWLREEVARWPLAARWWTWRQRESTKVQI
ncbi:pollen-specific leucine-rich repeat extensin-like protein 4 [Iris pallida]|uniref:Pollen-specific leucine-rich repeat extensin-like protein 4 n=1 Tax=Iris pallida TaxID=29817 RepID=A0AAX6IBM8_IRIPA|nr:pollen-specific leucine-rich repeat extensin-like protein 4 [Iris pallida]